MAKRGRKPHDDILTPRQWQVLELLRCGLTNREIAETLDITSDGAKFHVSEILGRLGVSSRGEAAATELAPREGTPAATFGAPVPRWRVTGQALRLAGARRIAGREVRRTSGAQATRGFGKLAA